MHNTLPSRLLMLGASGMAAFLDFSIGAAIVVLLAQFFGVEVTLIHLMLGGFFALLPDVDIAPAILFGRSVHPNHRTTLLHRPLFTLPAATSAAFLFAGTFWATVVFTCVLWHFLHDTKWTKQDGGIAWFWPLSKRYWSPAWGFSDRDDTNGFESYLKTKWLIPSTLSVSETSVGAVTLFAALWTLGYQLLAMLLASSIVLTMVSIWGIYAATFEAKFKNARID